MGDCAAPATAGEEAISLLASVLEVRLAGSARTAAAALISEFGTLGALLSPASHHRVARLAGQPAADLLVACSRMLWAALRARCDDVPILSHMDRAQDYLRLALAHQPVEHVRGLYLNGRHELIGDELLAIGSLSRADPGIRTILSRALDLGASGLILAHNHPSGDPTPSKSDLTYTRRLQNAADLLDIAIYDHLIFARGGFTSLREQNLM